MATRAEKARVRAMVANSSQKRVPVGVKAVTAGMEQKRTTLASRKGRAVHAPTKSLADAKAGKAGDGKKVTRWRTGPNGGEDQTTNGVRAGQRGADGPPGRAHPSRKNTRGSWPAGEKRIAPLTSRVKLRMSAPSARATRKQ